MRLSIEKESLIKSLNIVCKAISNRPSLGTQSSILIDATKGYIRLQAYNEDMTIQSIVNGVIDEEGMVGVDARLFSDIVRKLPEGMINIIFSDKEDDDNIEVFIECNNVKFNIQGIKGYLFNDLPEIKRDNKLEISQFSLKDIIRRTIFCTAPVSVNKVLEGELFVIKNGILRVEAIEQSRVAIRQIEVSNNELDVKVIIKGTCLNELIKIINDDTESMIDMYFMDSNVVFEFEENTIVMRKIEGNFFDTSNLKYNDYVTKIFINKRNLYECLDRTTLIAKEGDKKSVKLIVNDNNMNVSVKSQFGSIDENIDITKEGEDMEINFNPKLLIDALKAIDEENVTMYLIGKKFPCFIRNEEIYNYVVLPVLG